MQEEHFQAWKLMLKLWLYPVARAVLGQEKVFKQMEKYY